jgi:prophage antirepressor-like protein
MKIISENNVFSFDFNNVSNKIRTLQDEKGSIWFIANDVLTILGISSKGGKSDAIADLDEDEKGSFKTNSTNSEDQRLKEFKIISESGLYSLIMRSRKPVAKPFQKWVTKEVLPSIRKTGSYSLQKEEKVEFDFEEIQKVVNIGIGFLNEFDNLNPIKQIKLDTFVKQKTGESLLADFGISFENHYFLPTEIGNMIGMSGAEINLILEKKGFQKRDENGVWKPTEKGSDFCLEIGNKFNQLKWRISTIL